MGTTVICRLSLLLVYFLNGDKGLNSFASNRRYLVEQNSPNFFLNVDQSKEPHFLLFVLSLNSNGYPKSFLSKSVVNHLGEWAKN